MGYMDTLTRRAYLSAFGISKSLRAVDPWGCGCTECITGEYMPMHRISHNDLDSYKRAVKMGALRDNTDGELFPVFVPDDTDSERQRIRLILTDHVGSGTQFCVSCGWRPEMSLGEIWRELDERVALREHQLDLIMGADPVPKDY